MSFMKDFDHLKIQMKDILLATNNFDPSKVIGRGGFGDVYKGELSFPNGQIMLAFKQLDRRRGQGSVEFWKEVMMLSKYKHENLITLLHFCIDDDQMVLVYEYASRGSLDRYLNDPITLPWIRRLKILVEAARGVQFLHDPKSTHQRVLHRDIKSANILLDENWTAKVSDFGLSKLGPASQGHSYLISHGVGTPGYCDPLYMEFGFLSKESDVYSFGVVLFENLCGRLCYEYHNHELSNILVPKWRRCYEEKKLDEIILPGLKEQMDRGSLRSFAAIAYQCVKKARDERPTLADIVEVLEFSLKQQETLENMGEKMDPSVDNNDDSPKIVDKFKIFTLSDQNFQDQAHDHYSQPSPLSDGEGSCGSDSEDRPGIAEFQIIGDAKLGGKLLACGYPVRGTSLLMFQWVRLLQDGLMEYVEGATDPGYVVTADDVDKLIAVECIPVNERGQQGELVRLFANQQNRITCDPEMQRKLDDYISAGQASFNVLLLMDSFESGEQTTFSLRQYGYTIKINRTQDIFIREEYSTYFPSIVLSVDAPRIVLNRLNGPSHTFAFDDVRMRDTFVLTIRMFQNRSLLPHELEDRPGIEEFQIIGDAKLGGKLLACGFPVCGTSLCIFQWVRLRQDGARVYVEGATKPEYVVTADDVDNLIYVECTPISDRGQRGELVQLFANQQNRITCDPEMQRKLDDYMSAGQASFNVLLLMDSSKSWEQTTFSLRQYEYKIKINRTHDIFIHEKYASYLPSIVLSADAPQIVLKCLNWSSHTLTFDDIRMRDTFVLTIRMFQSKVLDERRMEACQESKNLCIRNPTNI